MTITPAVAVGVGSLAAAAERASFDCAMRAQLLRYAALQQPTRPVTSLQELADALNGDPLIAPNCTITVPSSLSAGRRVSRFAAYPLPTGALVVCFPERLGALQNGGAGGGDTIVLRGGTHYLTAPVALGAGDSGLTFQGFPGEKAWVSRSGKKRKTL